jgi:hypothetical protein
LVLCDHFSQNNNNRVLAVYIPLSSVTFMRNWFLSSNTRFRPCSIKVSNLTVNFAMRSRSSSKPKLILGRESAIDGASAEESGGRIALVESEGSKTVDIMIEM